MTSRRFHRRAVARLTAATLVVAAGTTVAAPSAHAATITVDTTADTVDGGDGVTSLREAFTEASTNGTDDTIVLAPGATYDLSSCAAGALTHTAAEALTVQGDGATIHQTCADAGVVASTDISATSVLTLVDLDLVGGPNTGVTVPGAGVFADGRLVLDSVTVTGVDAGPSGAVIESTFGPGGGTTVTAVDLTVTGNDGTAVGGDFISVSVTDSTLSGNSGSGIGLVDGTPVTVTGTTITDNGGRGISTTGQGNTRVTVSDAAVDRNARGGISCGACANLSVGGSTMVDNGDAATGGQGGGIRFTFDYDPVPTMPGVTVEESTISGNRALFPGGGISVATISEAFDPMTQPTFRVSDSVVSDNETVGDAMHGGGIFAGTTSVIVERTEVSGNVAGTGSAVPVHGGGLHVAEQFDDGIADGRDMIFDDSVVAGNSASGRGGGASLELDGRMEAQGLTFSGNTAGLDGGGLHLSTTDLGLDVARFTGNSAQRGGGLYADAFAGGGTYRVSGALVDANTATEHGGGVSADDLTSLRLTNSTVTANSAPEGGGVSVGIDPMDDGELVELAFTTVARNTAPVGANVVTYEGTVRTEAALVVQPEGGGTSCAPGTSVDAVGHSFTDDAGCAAAATDVVTGDDPLLGALGDNGGPTPTLLPAAASPVGGLVPVVACTEPVDQRGVTRPQGVACEPGSVEVEEEEPSSPGTDGPDHLIGTFGDDHLRGLGGPDVLVGLRGDDVLEGGDGSDLIVGGPGADALVGGPGSDVLVGDRRDTLDGGPGPDLCIGGHWFPRDC